MKNTKLLVAVLSVSFLLNSHTAQASEDQPASMEEHLNQGVESKGNTDPASISKDSQASSNPSNKEEAGTPKAKENKPQVTGKNISVDLNSQVSPTDVLDTLPEGARAEFVGEVDTKVAGPKEVEVKVTFKDNTEQIVKATITVKEAHKKETKDQDRSADPQVSETNINPAVGAGNNPSSQDTVATNVSVGLDLTGLNEEEDFNKDLLPGTIKADIVYKGADLVEHRFPIEFSKDDLGGDFKISMPKDAENASFTIEFTNLGKMVRTGGFGSTKPVNGKLKFTGTMEQYANPTIKLEVKNPYGRDEDRKDKGNLTGKLNYAGSDNATNDNLDASDATLDFSFPKGTTEVDVDKNEDPSVQNSNRDDLVYPGNNPHITIDGEADNKVKIGDVEYEVTEKKYDVNKGGSILLKTTDPILRPQNGDKTPEGYVRVNFKRGEGVETFPEYSLDVKPGTVLGADKYPTQALKAVDGYREAKWSVEPGTTITGPTDIFGSATENDNHAYEPTTKTVFTKATIKPDEDKIKGAVSVPGYKKNFTVTIDDPSQIVAKDNEESYTVDVTVEYADKTKDKAQVTVQVVPPINHDYEPTPKEIETTVGVVPNPEDGIANKAGDPGEGKKLPEKTTFEWIKKPDVSEGTKEGKEVKGTVQVTYPDASHDVVEVTVKVKETREDKDKYKATGGTINKDFGVETTEAEVIGQVTTNYPTTDPAKKPSMALKEGQTLPNGKTTGEFDVTVTVTYPDNSTKDVVVKVIVGKAKDTTKPTIGGLDDDNDPNTPPKQKEEDNKGPQVWADGARVVEGQAITPIKVAVTDDMDKNPTVEITGLPAGLSYNKDSKQIEGTPTKLTDWGTTEEERGFTATITAKDATGNESTKSILITVLRDTDGDGNPDTTDPDDDNDGITDDKDTNPKGKDGLDAEVTSPSVENGKAVPADTKVVTPNKPNTTITSETKDGLSVDANGNLTGTPNVTFGEGETSKVVTIPVTIKSTGTGAPGQDGNPTDETITKEVKVTVTKPGTPEHKDTYITGTVTPVNPTDEEQKTGLVVKNPDSTTNVTAVDEDGNSVPARIDENGNIVVTPGKKVDGPITLTIEDEDLPNKKVTYDVPVNGHSKGKDDNHSDTTPTGEKYQVVFNANGGTPTTQTASVKDGEKVTGVNEPTKEGFKFVKWVVLGTDKTFDLNANFSKDMITDGSKSLMVVAVWEKVEKNPTQADKITPNVPEKTGVKDPKNLTNKEKEEVKGKIEEANKDKFPDGTKVDVDDKGNATITYPDKSKDTIPAEDLVFQYEHGKPAIEEKPELPIADIIDPTVPEKTDVGDKNNLTDKEKQEIKDKIEEANKDKFPEGTKVEVDDKGNATITYPDGSKDIIPADKLVNEKPSNKGGDNDHGNLPDYNDDDNKPSDDDNKPSDDDKNKENNNTDAENNPPVVPKDKTGVKDPNHLTDKEKQTVREKVKKANPAAVDVKVDDKGNATLIYKDGSTNMIPASKLVYENSDNKDNKQGLQAPYKNRPNQKGSKNVKTGVGSVSGLFGILGAAISGLFASKKKEEDK